MVIKNKAVRHGGSHFCNHSIQKAKEGGSRVRSPSKLHAIARPFLKIQKAGGYGQKEEDCLFLLALL